MCMCSLRYLINEKRLILSNPRYIYYLVKIPKKVYSLIACIAIGNTIEFIYILEKCGN